MISFLRFLGLVVLAAAALFAAMRAVGNDYVFYAGYTVLEYVVLACAWNILGGYVGYVNFGVAAFLALGAYTGVALGKIAPLPLPVLMLAGGVVAGLVGLGTGYLTLRLRGIFFAIATLALAVVLQTVITNWDFVGGFGRRLRHPAEAYSGLRQLHRVYGLPYVGACSHRRGGQPRDRNLGPRIGLCRHPRGRSRRRSDGRPDASAQADRHHLERRLHGHGRGALAVLRDLLEPSSAFNLSYAVNSIAMPLIGGTTGWFGPVLGALLLGTAQQVVTVTISSEVNLLIVGLLLIGFVVLAPQGLIGLLGLAGRRRAS